MRIFFIKILLLMVISFTTANIAGCKKSSITPTFAGKTYYMKASEATSDNGKTWVVQSLTLCASGLKLVFNTDGTYTATDGCMNTKQGAYKYDQNTGRLTLTPTSAQTPDYDGIVENYSVSGFTFDQFAVQGTNTKYRIILSDV